MLRLLLVFPKRSSFPRGTAPAVLWHSHLTKWENGRWFGFVIQVYGFKEQDVKMQKMHVSPLEYAWFMSEYEYSLDMSRLTDVMWLYLFSMFIIFVLMFVYHAFPQTYCHKEHFGLWFYRSCFHVFLNLGENTGPCDALCLSPGLACWFWMTKKIDMNMHR